MKTLVLLLTLVLCPHSFASEAEPPKIKGYSIGMPIETAREMNRTLLADFLTKTGQGQSAMTWIGGQDGLTKVYHYTLFRVGGEREADLVRATPAGSVDRIVFDRLAFPLFQIEGVDNRKIIAAFEAAYGLSKVKITEDDVPLGLTAVWYHASGVKITIRCYNDSLRLFMMEKADDDASLRAKLN